MADHNVILSVWLRFSLCVLLIGYAGAKLSRYGDVIAEKTGLGGSWIGLILLATVTSLPELVTGISAVAIAGAPNIAIGDALGSCVFNLAIIVVLDFLHRAESVYTRASQGHILAAGFSVILIGMVGFNLSLGSQNRQFALGPIGIYTPLIVLLYAVAVRTVFRYEQRQLKEYVTEAIERYPDIALRQSLWRYALAASVVVGMGIWLPFLGEQMAEVMGWHQSFVGTLLIGFATSVPELVVTIAAVRLGALDLAIGNLLGSNLFDMLIVAADDLFFPDGPILSYVAPVHAVSAFSAMMMTGVAIVGLLYRPRGRLFKTVGWLSLFLFSLYLLNSYVLYLYGE